MKCFFLYCTVLRFWKAIPEGIIKGEKEKEGKKERVGQQYQKRKLEKKKRAPCRTNQPTVHSSSKKGDKGGKRGFTYRLNFLCLSHPLLAKKKERKKFSFLSLLPAMVLKEAEEDLSRFIGVSLAPNTLFFLYPLRAR